MMSFFQTRAWQMFEAKLLKSLEKIADQLERANDLTPNSPQVPHL